MMKKNYSFAFSLFLCFFIISCATQNADYGKNAKNYAQIPSMKDSISYTFYLVGDAGEIDQDKIFEKWKHFQDTLAIASENSSILFLGDNIYPVGMPKKNDPTREKAEKKIDNQIKLADNFKGNMIFIPGNHDWYNNGIKGLKREEDYVQEKTGDKSSFGPKNGCPIETRKINKTLTLILIDSEWVLADWDKNPGINEKCEIKTREDFYAQFEKQINKNQNKTIVVAMHHPLITHGSHGGYDPWKKQLFPLESNVPLPILGSLLNLVRATGGVTHQDISNQNYKKFADRIKTLISGKPNIVVVSGHDHNLQYIDQGNIHQIISGAGSKTEGAKAVGKNDFSLGNTGYVTLKISKTGNAEVSYFGIEKEEPKLRFRTEVLTSKNNKIPNNYLNVFPENTKTSIYQPKNTQKSKWYEFLWGKHYRNYYGKEILAKNVDLDTLYGGLKPSISGGGHQTRSLKLESKDGKEFAMRALKKSGVRFLQSVAFKNQYVIDDFTDSYADKFLLDFYTTSHPFTPLVIGEMSQKIAVAFTSPQLFYIPKQKTLGKGNTDFGDELYYVEEKPTENEDNPNKVLGSLDVLQNLTKDEKYKMDEKSWIRARLFDMLIGDWDRHYDQWKFVENKQNNNIIYTPIPKDRDQAFSKYDGFILSLMMSMPDLRHMQTFDSRIKNVKWFNREPYPLDLAFTKNSELKDWQNEADFIQNHLSESDIRNAFTKNLPKEMQDAVSEDIIKKIISRNAQLITYATKYFEILQHKVLLTGTDKKDKFLVTRMPNNDTEIKIYRMKKDGEELVSSKIYNKKTTNEIWLYGLSDDDVFISEGKENGMKIRMFGGLDKDDYQISNGKNISIYDYKSKKNNLENAENASVTLTDDYDINQYNYNRPKYSAFSYEGNFGYNPDDGVITGINSYFIINNFIQNPFSAKHSLNANYFFDSKGYEMNYQGIFPKLLGNWYYQVDARYSSSLFIRNFFGVGNDSFYDKNLNEEEYNRVRAEELKIIPSFNWKKNAAKFSAKLIYQNIEIDKKAHHFIDIPGNADPEIFSRQQFAGAETSFEYANYDNKSNPKSGMKFDLIAGWKTNLKKPENQLPYLETGLGFTHFVTQNQKVVWSSYAKAKWLLSEDYLFYQMATLGGNQDLRGFRFNRFYGKNSFYQTTDLRVEIGKIKTSVIPITYGIFGGFDLGRVWNPYEISNKWHNSFGGGIWFNAIDSITFNTSYFASEDGGRFVFGFGWTL